ncbi:hypothetical protein SLEP1_g57305 [Rubroshorea leprosula]|uniref:Uncharacterized protein n=1 Tax=Rubroshorea leprosula TaxID=152421 RepID=A0AAV5MPU0_9ROSI|nr:hypothetical protein SLEP1_g57305 [Rubroshorea leprosula]
MAEKESEYDDTSDSNQSAISLSNSKISRRTLAPPPTPPLVVLKSPALASSSMTLPSTSKSFFSLNRYMHGSVATLRNSVTCTQLHRHDLNRATRSV